MVKEVIHHSTPDWTPARRTYMMNPSTLDDVWAAEALIKRGVSPKGARVVQTSPHGSMEVTIPAKGGGQYMVTLEALAAPHLLVEGEAMHWRITILSPDRGYCTEAFVRACLPDFRESLPEEFRNGHLDWIAGPSPAWRERAVAYALAWARRSNRP